MKRVISVLLVLGIMAATLVAMAAPALASNTYVDHPNGWIIDLETKEY